MPIENDGIRIPVTVIVEMTGEQVKDYAAEFGLELRAKDIVADVNSYVLTAIQGSAALEGATVYLKGQQPRREAEAG